VERYIADLRIGAKQRVCQTETIAGTGRAGAHSHRIGKKTEEDALQGLLGDPSKGRTGKKSRPRSARNRNWQFFHINGNTVELHDGRHRAGSQLKKFPAMRTIEYSQSLSERECGKDQRGPSEKSYAVSRECCIEYSNPCVAKRAPGSR